MRTRNSKPAAGILIVVGLFLLIALGKLDLLAILLPISLLLAYGIAWSGATRTRLTSGPRKG
jgi:hypothetical protein